MMGSNFTSSFTDKITEYHILNAQLMSKAMTLLDSANDFMTDNDANHPKMKKKSNMNFSMINNDVLDSTLEYYKPENFSYSEDTGNTNIDLAKDSLVEEKNMDEVKIEDMELQSDIGFKKKFIFPVKYSENDCEPLNMENGSNLTALFSDNEEEKFVNLSTKYENASSNLVERLLKTKLTIQQTGKPSDQNTVKQKLVEQHETPIKNDGDKITGQCIKALKFKIENLQEEIRNIQDKLKKKTLECEEHSKNNQDLQDNKIKLLTQINNLKSNLGKKEEKILSLNTRTQALEMEIRSLKSEHETILRNSKEIVQETSATEIRLTRALKEITNLKESLNNYQQNEKELKENSRKQIEKFTEGIKTAEKREKTLITTVKKQTLLIDNLKKQISYLEAKKDVTIAEKQLDSILKWEHK